MHKIANPTYTRLCVCCYFCCGELNSTTYDMNTLGRFFECLIRKYCTQKLSFLPFTHSLAHLVGWLIFVLTLFQFSSPLTELHGHSRSISTKISSSFYVARFTTFSWYQYYHKFSSSVLNKFISCESFLHYIQYILYSIIISSKSIYQRNVIIPQNCKLFDSINLK